MSPLPAEVIKAWAASFDPAEIYRTGWTAELLLQSAQEKRLFYMLDGAGALIAAVIYYTVDQNTDEILFLGTIPRARGRGVMEKLLRDFKARSGQTAIWLECREDNLPAIELYKKIGFKEAGRRLRYYKDGTTAILFNF